MLAVDLGANATPTPIDVHEWIEKWLPSTTPRLRTRIWNDACIGAERVRAGLHARASLAADYGKYLDAFEDDWE